MKVTGFSFIRNAVLFQYPVVEAIQSILPLCDEVVVAVGASEDNTRELVQAIHSKIKIIDTVWDEALREKGKVLAEESNKALQAIPEDTDWCLYIQGDEVLHEDGYTEVRAAMQQYKEDKNIDGLLFNYRHFYGSYDYTGVSSRWYKHEIRAFKTGRGIYSYRDAQGFRKGNNEKLTVKKLNAYIHHYGWVREPKAMQAKATTFGKYFDKNHSAPEDTVYSGEFDYSEIDALSRYTGTHPKVMQSRVQSMNWKFEYDLSFNRTSWKDRLKNGVEKLTGKRPFDHNNYRII